VDEDGQLILPPETITRLGLVPGTEILLENTVAGTTLRRAATHLAKVYVEPTSRCNLNCEICIRNSWTEIQGDMTGETFGCLLESLRRIEYKPVICFGGFGEPLLHPNIVEMVARAKDMLSEWKSLQMGSAYRTMVRDFVHIGLDILWFSVDSPHTERMAGRQICFQKLICWIPCVVR
jgi:MoaA/NifB/PqqE/SkfB family radical SAM enzyme